MSSKEIKAALKAAKTSIQSKEYQEALHHCNFILKRDGANYNALVFSGLCYSETIQNEQARDAYNDAIKSQPDQILAYQGLANLYSKHWKPKKTKDELRAAICTYEKLLSLMGRKDLKKYIDLCLTLCDAYMEFGDMEKAISRLDVELSSLEEDDVDSKLCLHRAVLKTIEAKAANSIFKIKYSILIIEAFTSVLSQSTASRENAMKVLDDFTTYLQADPNQLLLETCLQLHERFPSANLPLEILIRAHIQENETPDFESINGLCEKLKNNGGTFADVGIGFTLYQNGEYEKAQETLGGSMPDFPTFLPGWIILCKAFLKIHRYSDADKVARCALTQYKMISIRSLPIWKVPIMSLEVAKYELSKCLAAGMCGSHLTKNIKTGIETFNKLLQMQPDDIFSLLSMSKGLIKLEEFKEATNALQRVLSIEPVNTDAQAWNAYIMFKRGNVPESISHLESISPPTPLSLYLLGKSMWEAGGEYRKEKKNCFTALVKAAKLDAYNADIFLLLGHFYSQVQSDNGRAKGCYQKSYQLDPLNEEAGCSLADVYVTEGDTDSAIELYEGITKGAGPAGYKWAWLRLGLCKLKAKDINNAIQCFQSALRIDADDAICWECLGEGYLHRGSYTAAWKAFGRAHELNPNSVYSLYQMAKVKQVQGMYSDAIKEYAGVLDLFPDYVPALQGLGESELLHANHMMNVGRFQTGIEHSQNAIGHLMKACCLRSDLCCLWKLLGDCCVLVHPLDGSVVKMKVPKVLLGTTQRIGEDMNLVEVDKKELLTLSSRFYCRAIHLQSDNASLWHDLGLSYFRQVNESDGDLDDLTKKAMDAVKKAIVLEPTNNVFWCSLGVLASSEYVDDPAFAQHCFLKSIQNEQNNVQAWSNLATLYLSHGHVKKAHEAFKVSQSLEPSFVSSWIGQAIIAETIGSEETMDLFRHSTELGLHPQAAAGYSSWVARVMSDMRNRSSALFVGNIRNMNAVPTATTQMSKQCDRNPSCPWSSTLNGFLLEYSGLNGSSEEAYNQAYQSLVQKKKEYIEKEELEVLKNQKNKAASNLARMLCKNEKYDESISTYQSISPLSDFHDVCGLALSFYKSGQFMEAIEAYKQAGQLTTTDENKALVMVAMAITFWKMGKQDEAKTLLFKCFQTCKSALHTLCALGIEMKDQKLVGAAVGEILKQKVSNKKSEDKFSTDDCLLISAAAELCGDPKIAVNEVQKALHANPSSWSLRMLLCRLLVYFKGFRGVRSAALISNQANQLSHNHHLSNRIDLDSDLWQGPRCHDDQVSVLQCSALSNLAAGRTVLRQSSAKMSDRLRQAQKFARMHPYESSSMAILSCACHAEDTERWISGKSSPYSKLVESLALRSLHMTSSSCSSKHDLPRWTSVLSAWSQVLNQEEIKPDKDNSDLNYIHLLQKAFSCEDKTELSHVVQEITSLLPKTTNTQIYMKHFSQVLEKLGIFEASKQMLEKSIEISTNDTEKFSLHLQILRLAFGRIFNSKTDQVQKDKWCAIMRDTITEALKINSTSSLISLFQAFSMRVEKNHRKSKSYLSRVMNSTDVITDDVRSVAIWYLYRTLHERNDVSEIEKLVSKALEMEDPHIARILDLLPAS